MGHFLALVLFLAKPVTLPHPPPRTTPVRAPSAPNPNYPRRAADLSR